MRDEWPLEVGDTIEVDGEVMMFIDYPTDGPLFETRDGRRYQVPSDEADKLL